MKKHSGISYWYIIIALSVVVIAVWLFLELKQQQEKPNVSKLAASYASPVHPTFDTQVIDHIKSRFQILQVDLLQTPAYTKNSILNPAASNLDQLPLASQSAQPLDKRATQSGTIKKSAL